MIRVKGHISGPFSTDEIMEMIESKKLSPKDEVNKPLKQWIYVKNALELNDLSTTQTTTNIPLFKKKRPRKNWMEDTVVLESPPQPEKEETKTAQVIEKENTEPRVKDLDLENAEVIDYKVDEEYENTSSEESSAQFADIEQAKKKASLKSRKAMKKYIWFLFFVCCIFITPFLFRLFFKNVETTTTSELLSGRKFFNQEDYRKSLNLFKKIPIVNDSDRLKLASMLVQIEGNIYQAQILIEKINNLPQPEQSKLQILKGIIAHKNNNIESAENFFTASLTHSLFLGTLHKVMLNIKDHEKALSLLNQIDFSVEEMTNKNLLLFLKAYLESLKKEEDSALALQTPDKKENSTSASETPDEKEGSALVSETSDEKEDLALTKLLMSPQGDYKQEALLLLLHKQVLAGDEEYKKTVKQVLDQDPYLTQEYKSDILSYKPHFIWKELLLDLCSNITQNNSNSYFIALKSLCLAQSGQNTLALKNIEKAKVQSPQDPLISSISVFVSSQNNLDEHTLLDHSLKHNQNYALPLILKARFCQKQKDVYCTHNYWSQVYKKNTQSLSAVTGTAWSYSEMGRKESAQEWIQAGLSISNQYKPLLQLKDSL